MVMLTMCVDLSPPVLFDMLKLNTKFKQEDGTSSALLPPVHTLPPRPSCVVNRLNPVHMIEQ